MADEDSAEVVEFLKLVEQARTESEAESDLIAQTASPEPPLSAIPKEPKKIKFGRKKKVKESKLPIQVLIREVQQTPISPYISVAAILVALFVALASVLTTTL